VTHTAYSAARPVGDIAESDESLSSAAVTQLALSPEGLSGRDV